MFSKLANKKSKGVPSAAVVVTWQCVFKYAIIHCMFVVNAFVGSRTHNVPADA